MILHCIDAAKRCRCSFRQGHSSVLANVRVVRERLHTDRNSISILGPEPRPLHHKHGQQWRQHTDQSHTDQ
jgi:hypothetical protein